MARNKTAVKKMLMVLYQFPPCSDVGAFRPIKFIRHLAEFGWYPIILAPSNGIFNAYDPLLETEIADRCKIYRAPLHPKSIFRRGTAIAKEIPRQRLWRFWNRVLLPDGAVSWIPAAVAMGRRIVKNEDISLVLASGQPFSTFIIGNFIRKRTQIKLLLDYRDPWTLNPFYKGSGARLLMERRLEKNILERADAAVFLTEESTRLHQEAFGRLLPAAKCHTITNSFEWAGEDEHAHKSVDHFMIVHAGNLYGNRNPKIFLEGLSLAASRNRELRQRTRCLFYGIYNSNEFRRQVRELGLDGLIRLRSRIPQRELLPILRKANVLLLINSHGPGHHVFIPAKFFDYLQIGTPILCLTEDGSLKKAMKETSAGVVVDPRDPEKVCTSLESLFLRIFVKNEPFHVNKKQVMVYESRQTTKKLAGLCNVMVELKNGI